MNFNHGTPISSKFFRWSSGIGFAAMSDLGPAEFRLHQVWADSIDRGFTIKSDRTGELRTFVEHRQTTERGEVVAWVYVSLNSKTGKIDTTQDVLWITIYND